MFFPDSFNFFLRKRKKYKTNSVWGVGIWDERKKKKVPFSEKLALFWVLMLGFVASAEAWRLVGHQERCGPWEWWWVDLSQMLTTRAGGIAWPGCWPEQKHSFLVRFGQSSKKSYSSSILNFTRHSFTEAKSCFLTSRHLILTCPIEKCLLLLALVKDNFLLFLFF